MEGLKLWKEDDKSTTMNEHKGFQEQAYAAFSSPRKIKREARFLWVTAGAKKLSLIMSGE
jgi:hypothetical protein